MKNKFSGFIYGKGIWNRNKKIPLEVEWDKWLRYESEIEKEKVALIHSKSIDEITHEDIEFLKRKKTSSQTQEVLKQYLLDGKFTEETWPVIEMCKTNSSLLEKIMIDKLTKEELLEAEKKLSDYKQIKELDTLGEIVNNFENSYDDLSYVDAFVFHYLADYYYYINYRVGMQAANEAYSRRALRNDKIRHDSYVYAMRGSHYFH